MHIQIKEDQLSSLGCVYFRANKNEATLVSLIHLWAQTNWVFLVFLFFLVAGVGVY